MRLPSAHQLKAGMLLDDMPQYRNQAKHFEADTTSQRRLLRSLMNERPPEPLRREYLALQDELLSAEREEKGVVNVTALPTTKNPKIVLWQYSLYISLLWSKVIQKETPNPFKIEGQGS